MNKWVIFLLAIIIKSTGKTISGCPSYKHGDLYDKMSCFEKLTDSEFIMQECPFKYKCSLNEEGDKGQCELSNSFEYELVYPGGYCKVDEDCSSLKCINNICQGSQLGEKCQYTANCVFGLLCSDVVCIHPKPLNGQCKDHSECTFPLMCFNGKCTQLFSVENGIEMDEENRYLCKSGKVYNNICNQLKNINLECDDDTPCKYEDLQGNQYEIESACKCPYVNELNAKKRCTAGDLDNEVWEKVMDILKETTAKENTDKCNLEEKRPGFCLEQLKNSWDYRRKKIHLEKYIIESVHGSTILSDNNKHIIFKTIFGFDDSLLLPKNGFKCPIYKTDFPKDFMDSKTCVFGMNPFNENGDQIFAYINKNACQDGYKCNYDPTKLDKDKTYNATCTQKRLWKSSYHLHLPGDQCENSDQCQKGNYPDVGLCNNNVCSGHNEGKTCNTHIDCMKGLYCAEDNTCKKQLTLGQSCIDSYDCRNKYGCMNNTCHEYYSLSNGAYLDARNPNPLFCEFSTENKKTHQCIELLYHMSNKPNENGFIECENQYQHCNYTYPDSDDIIEKPCQCGYNNLGKAFCPLSHNENRKYWNKYLYNKKSVLDNTCHTLKRFDCPEKDYTDDISYYQRMSEKAHLFYLAENDVIQALTSSYLSNSIITILFPFFILLVI